MAPPTTPTKPSVLNAAATALLSNADRLARLLDVLSAVFARELSTVLRDLERSIGTWVRSHTATGRIQAARAAVLRAELQQVLEGAGFQQLFDDASQAATDRLLASIQGFQDVRKTARFTSSHLLRVEALRTEFLRAVVPTDAEILAPLWRTVLYGTYSGRPREALIADLADTLDRSQAQITTLYDTAMSAYSRQMSALTVPDDPDALFLYAGPADTRIRPFCAEHVGRVYARSEIDDLDNGQLPNVFITGGGYNCRHSWQPLSSVSELRELHETGGRVPRVEQDLRWAAAANPRRGRAA